MHSSVIQSRPAEQEPLRSIGATDSQSDHWREWADDEAQIVADHRPALVIGRIALAVGVFALICGAIQMVLTLLHIG
ncbi:MAG: hypothetical protein AB1508_14875 [Pseudomonadota bacterium]